MLEIKVTIAAADIAAAISNLAEALRESKPHTVCHQYGKNSQQIENVGTLNIGAKPKTADVTTVMPVTAPATSCPQVSSAPNDSQSMPVAESATSCPQVNSAADPNPAMPTTAPAYTLEMLATAGTSLIDLGKLDQLRALLSKYGVDNLTVLPPEQYGAVATELRALGAKI